MECSSSAALSQSRSTTVLCVRKGDEVHKIHLWMTQCVAMPTQMCQEPYVWSWCLMLKFMIGDAGCHYG